MQPATTGHNTAGDKGLSRPRPFRRQLYRGLLHRLGVPAVGQPDGGPRNVRDRRDRAPEERRLVDDGLDGARTTGESIELFLTGYLPSAGAAAGGVFLGLGKK